MFAAYISQDMFTHSPPHTRNSSSPTHSFRNPTKCSVTNRHSKLVYILVGKLKIQYTVYTIKPCNATKKQKITRMWANAQPDGRPAEHRWRPLFNAAKFA